MTKIRFKECRVCRRSKRLSQFPPSKKSRDGKSSKCIACTPKTKQTKPKKEEVMQQEPPEIAMKIHPYAFIGLGVTVADYNKSRLNNLLRKICDHYKYPLSKVISSSRLEDVVYIRQMFCYVSYSILSTVTLKQVGDIIGRRDHTTVMYAKNLIQSLIDTDASTPKKLKTALPMVRADYDNLIKLLS